MFFEGQFAHVCVGSPAVKYVYLQLAIATSIYVALSPHVKSFWAFISFRFGIFLLSFPFILIFWAFISFHFGLVGFQVL